jgi:hypothetical protein
VSVVCLSGTGLCNVLITRPEEFYRLWCVLVCDLATSRVRRLEFIKGCKRLTSSFVGCDLRLQYFSRTNNSSAYANTLVPLLLPPTK